MESSDLQPGPLRRAVNDLVMAEMFLIQATLESASAIGDGVNEFLNQEEDSGESVADALQQLKDSALEPYTSRYQYFREMVGNRR